MLCLGVSTTLIKEIKMTTIEELKRLESMLAGYQRGVVGRAIEYIEKLEIQSGDHLETAFDLADVAIEGLKEKYLISGQDVLRLDEPSKPFSDVIERIAAATGQDPEDVKKHYPLSEGSDDGVVEDRDGEFDQGMYGDEKEKG